MRKKQKKADLRRNELKLAKERAIEIDKWVEQKRIEVFKKEKIVSHCCTS
jgi:hypothetical protein